MRYMPVVLMALVAFSQTANSAITYSFSEPLYTLDENGNVNTDVLLRRSGDPGVPLGQTRVLLYTECPTQCPPLQDSSIAIENDDFTIDSKTITFPATVEEVAVSITILDDTDEEWREYFCLSVAKEEEHGIQWYTRIFIPWNDACVYMDTPFDGGTPSPSSHGYAIDIISTAVAGYVGPWSTDDKVEISVTPEQGPEATSADANINIFLTTSADPNEAIGTFDYYGILLDDEFANNHGVGGAASGDSIIVKDSIISAELAAVTADYVLDATNTYELTYDRTSGYIAIDRTSSTSVSTLDTTDSTPLAINHLFVSTAGSMLGEWKICGLVPRRLPVVDAHASGFIGAAVPRKVIDDNTSPGSKSCFISDSSNPWLQLDLGQEFKVEKVVIFPITSVEGGVDAEWLNDARVYVGNCGPNDVTSNNICDSDIDQVADNDADSAFIIEVSCDGDNVNGRYVYILPAASSNNGIALCEVRVFGDEVSVDGSATVEFSTTLTKIDEDASRVTIAANRTGGSCIYVDYYTDDSSGDFIEVEKNTPKTISWIGSTASASQEFTIDIVDDNICESSETFNVYFSNVVGAQFGPKCWTSVEIRDNEAITYSINTIDPISEGRGPLRIQVDRTGSGPMQAGTAALTFADGTAQSGDYDNKPVTVSFSSTTTSTDTSYGYVTIVDDNCYEEEESFTVSLDSLEPSVCSSVQAPSTATVIIEDNDSRYKWSLADDDEGTESSDRTIVISEGDDPIDIDITREGVAQAKSIGFEIDSATAGDDDFDILPASNRVTFQANYDTESITVNIEDDDQVENDEFFTLTLQDQEGSTCSNGNRGNPYRINVHIRDNDAEYFWKQSTYNVGESDGEVVVCVVREGDTTTSKTIQIISEGVTTSASESAKGEEDFRPLTQIAFTGTAEQCVPVQIIGDDEVEGPETFTLTITGGKDVIAGEPNVVTVTINDDDVDLGWERPSYTFSEESGSSAEVVITKSGDIEVTVNVAAVSGSATSGEDFTLEISQVTIPALSSSHAVRLQITDDDINEEPDEYFTLTLSLAPGSPGTISQAITSITITDNDLPTEAPQELSPGAVTGIVVGVVVAAITATIIIGVGIYMYGSAGAAAGSLGKQQPQVGTELANFDNPGNSFNPYSAYNNSYGINGNEFQYGGGYGNLVFGY